MADGVGSWVERNVDPAIYSRLLMENAKKAAKTMTASQESPQKVLEKAHSQTDVQVVLEVPSPESGSTYILNNFTRCSTFLAMDLPREALPQFVI